jgi:hypothetical protein
MFESCHRFGHEHVGRHPLVDPQMMDLLLPLGGQLERRLLQLSTEWWREAAYLLAWVFGNPLQFVTS